MSKLEDADIYCLKIESSFTVHISKDSLDYLKKAKINTKMKFMQIQRRRLERTKDSCGKKLRFIIYTYFMCIMIKATSYLT